MSALRANLFHAAGIDNGEIRMPILSQETTKSDTRRPAEKYGHTARQCQQQSQITVNRLGQRVTSSKISSQSARRATAKEGVWEFRTCCQYSNEVSCLAQGLRSNSTAAEMGVVKVQRERANSIHATAEEAVRSAYLGTGLETSRTPFDRILYVHPCALWNHVLMYSTRRFQS